MQLYCKFPLSRHRPRECHFLSQTQKKKKKADNRCCSRETVAEWQQQDIELVDKLLDWKWPPPHCHFSRFPHPCWSKGNKGGCRSHTLLLGCCVIVFFGDASMHSPVNACGMLWWMLRGENRTLEASNLTLDVRESLTSCGPKIEAKRLQQLAAFLDICN